MLGLIYAWGAHRPEVIGSDGNTALAGLRIIVHIEFIADGGTLCRLDEDEGYGIVGCAADIVAAALAHVCDTEFIP